MTPARLLALTFSVGCLVVTGVKSVAESAAIVAKEMPSGELSPASELRKLSLHLRGRLPTPDEQSELLTAELQGQARTFLQATTRAYLGTPEHAAKMSYRLEELFRLKTDLQSETEPDSILPGAAAPIEPYQRRNALNELFLSMTRENRSWDDLLTSKRYVLRAMPASAFGFSFRVSDYGFFGAVARAQLPPMTNGIIGGLIDVAVPERIAVQFAEDDARIAGALTTPRFLQRNVNTAVNKNRRRAAAVFRIFLCDLLLPVVAPPSGAIESLLDRAFPPNTSGVTEKEIRAMRSAPDKHGANAACNVCHFKLDPLGKTFLASAVALSSKPSPGALVFKNAKGEIVNLPGRGVGDVAASIARQPEYVRCQVRQFWDWFVGSDRILTPDREVELTARFDALGRRTNDFIAELVGSSEFRSPFRPTAAQFRAQAVKSILKNCTSCHDEKTPDFTKWPIGGASQSMREMVAKISERMDLTGGGADREMPPRSSPWQLTGKMFELIKNWVQDGAPDENGVPQL